MSEKFIPTFMWDKAISPEYRKYRRTSKCPKCGYFHSTPQYVKSDGTEINPVFFKIERDTFIECPKCRYRFPICTPLDETNESKPIADSNILVHWSPQEKRMQVASELVNVPPGVTITVKRSRTIEHSIDINWQASIGSAVEAGIKQVISASIHSEIEKRQGRAYRESETIAYDIELSGERSNRYKVIWTDVWLIGNIEVSQNNSTKIIPFEFHERSELEVVPLV